MKLDILNKKILYELEKDSSQPASKIAKKLKQSKEVILYRIHKLEEEKILLGCSAIVDMAKLNYFTFRIYIKWQNMTEEEKQKFYDQIKTNENVWTTTVMHGAWDFAFFIGVKVDEYVTKFHTIWNNIQIKYKHKIAATKIALYAPVHNFNKQFFIETKEIPIERIYGAGTPTKFDELDENIIKEYSSNVRQPLNKIAEKLRTTTETVRQRIKKLEKNNVIVGYKINLNLPEMGYQGYRVDFSLNSIERNKELFEYLKQHKYFYQINKSIGGADFETEIVVESLDHLLKILEEIMKKFKDVMRNYDYMGYSEFPSLSIVPD
ncbi:Lrp/AsnC family transcriptional regulator [Candidatus Woesearchaeota archaeon]|nr:Lrp/AsnC family transcriptional regulator [Candidatus Woesearchaeota archaeon]MCF7900726.1 Lrp/AsnC family transcriptional regulator [Candidatus Woesearchaeota archaeon]MCF8013247.1 Lrp/AsnC family transcriptional regulator [Candidatus Woesearchaeota archaeon]